MQVQGSRNKLPLTRCRQSPRAVAQARIAFGRLASGVFLTVPELAKLQGFDYKKLKFDKDVPLTAQGGMIGNAMSLPVLKFVMKRALLAAGMMKK